MKIGKMIIPHRGNVNKESVVKNYDIWVGYYPGDQGSFGPTKPELVATVPSINFKTACMKHELISKFDRILEGEFKGDLNSQDYPWWFDENKVSNSWIGKYYESEEDAWLSFPKYVKEYEHRK